MTRKNKFFLTFLFSFFYSNFSYSKNFPPEVHSNAETLNFVSEIEKIKIPKGGFKSFYYTKDFGIMMNDLNPEFDLKKAVKLGKHMHAVGLTVKETRPETKFQFEDYECAIHLFVDHRDDYWLPPGITGSWFEGQRTAVEVDDFDLRSYEIGYPMTNYHMRSFHGNTNTDDLPDYPRVLGSTMVSRFVRNIYPGIDYLKYNTFCIDIIKDRDILSIWLEKTSGPDFQVERAYHYAKDFYIFPIPKQMLKDSCEYVKKAAYYWVWNDDLEIFIKRPDLKDETFTLWRGKKYSCDFKN